MSSCSSPVMRKIEEKNKLILAAKIRTKSNINYLKSNQYTFRFETQTLSFSSRIHLRIVKL